MECYIFLFLLTLTLRAGEDIERFLPHTRDHATKNITCPYKNVLTRRGAPYITVNTAAAHGDGPRPVGPIAGRVVAADRGVTKMTEQEWKKVRGAQISLRQALGMFTTPARSKREAEARTHIRIAEAALRELAETKHAA